VNLRFFDVVFFAKPLNASGGVYQFLLAREERMAGGTNFNLYVPGRGTGFYNIPAGAGDLRCFVFRVNLISHIYPPCKSSSKSGAPLPDTPV
jgi:hypothetical protein